MTYLDHDHRERENIRFLGTWPFIQDLWRSPPRGVPMVMRSTSYGIQVLSDCSEAKIHNARVTGVVHKDVWLVGYQYCGEMRLKTTYSLKVPMNHIAGVEVAEALSDVG